MQIYLVGGAVRDKLLDIPVKDRDWVVVGATVPEMLALGYQQVGKDFPVFLHPQSKEEYALARTERKTGSGYTGFSVHAAPDVSLEEDLLRRDLTINAMAEDSAGNLIDPYQGRRDIHERILRHVSPAFGEDPLRVLRVARFAARFAHLGFSVAPETLELMRGLVATGEMGHLVSERVWQEMQRALAEKSPAVFFQTLRDCGALADILPELNNLFGVPQPATYHPEIDTGIHCLMALEQAAALSLDPAVRFAALTHDVGKALTPREKWPTHTRHEVLGAALIEALCERLRVPVNFRELAKLVCLHHTACHRAERHDAGELLTILEQLDAFRRPERFEQVLLACEADARGRTGLEERTYPQAALLQKALKLAAAVDIQASIKSGLRGADIGAELGRQRLLSIQQGLALND
ncbi:MAG: multifunctional CCA addition/repair protein [Pseudomonadales bacterium]|nr:multifunctional CCA addition/repair protein [Pseudomonadales bacterium]